METKRHPVNLKQYRKVNEKWQFVAVARDAKGNPDPRLIVLNGHPVNSKGGTFYLDYKENGARRQTAVGTNAREALEAWRTKLAELTGLIEVDPETENAANAGLTIDQAIASYLTEVEATKGVRTFRQYRRELEWFRSHCRKRYVAELDRSDAMRLFVEGRKEFVDGRPLNQKTINRRIIIMLNAMRSLGAVIEMKKGDWPKTVDKKIEIYQPEELKEFFDVCDPEERLVFQVFLCTGFREREVALAWSDIHWKEGKLGVSAKPELGFTPKSYEERSVPVPMALIDALRARKESSKSILVFPTLPHPTRPEIGKGDNPNGHLLELCKEVALRAGLNCGHCKGEHTVYALNKGVAEKVKRTYKCDSTPRCRNWYLHKFRHTFATNILQSVDIRSLQVMLGHKNIATTEKYLKSLRLDQLRERIESSPLTAFVK